MFKFLKRLFSRTYLHEIYQVNYYGDEWSNLVMFDDIMNVSIYYGEYMDCAFLAGIDGVRGKDNAIRFLPLGNSHGR